MRTLIVHNLLAGFGSDAIFAFERSLIMSGDECLLRTINDDFDVHAVLADAEQFDCVVLSGGDGTVATLLYELRDRPVMACVFPSGTANLLFANLGCAPEPAAIARACRAGHTVRTDLGEMSWGSPDGHDRSRGFSIMAGTGYDAEIMRAAIPNKQAMGEAAYFFAALSDTTPDVIEFTIEVDGTTYVRKGIACMVANNAMMQGDIEIVPDSRMDDGLLDVIILETSDARQLLRPLFAGVVDPTGKNVGRPWIEYFHGSDITVTCSKPVPMQIDGEIVSDQTSSYHARALKGVNRLVVDRMSRYFDRSDDNDPLFPDSGEQAFPK